ncbi:hypothetical protein V5D56_16425 [Cellulosimicrobium sp. PMB13]|uniref:hypothetical protein n=1 Tax=Cellulosimicrobium sp. PMB13 TaxID=3120158 RepID=UPI003F4C6434
MTPPRPAAHPAHPDDDTPATTGRLSWPTVLGLGSMALLWPLTGLLGLGSGAPRALTILGLTALVWIAVVGLGRVARPVLTLTLAGLTFGVVAAAVSALVGLDGGRAAWTLVPALALSTFWGLVAGAVAALVQRVRDGVAR